MISLLLTLATSLILSTFSPSSDDIQQTTNSSAQFGEGVYAGTGGGGSKGV